MIENSEGGNKKKDIDARNKLNDLNAKEWMIKTRSVWKASDYDLDDSLNENIRHVKNLIQFFTKRKFIIYNPNNDVNIKNIGENEDRIVVSEAEENVDFILLYEKSSFSNVASYKSELLSNKLRSKYIHFYKVLKQNYYLCIILRDFYFQNSELILYHYNFSRLLQNVGFSLKGLTIWVPKIKSEIRKKNNPNSSIINHYILVLRKEGEYNDNLVNNSFKLSLDYNDPLLAKDTRYYKSVRKSISPPRDKFKAQHPATFPEPDVKDLVEFFTDINNEPNVLDPFSGSGTTLIACSDLGIQGYGIELTKKWVDITKERFFLRGNSIIIDDSVLSPTKESPIYKERSLIQVLKHGDAKEKINEDDIKFDFIITSPPYWGILTKKIDHKTKKERLDKGLDTKYTIEGKDKTFDKDLANIETYTEFLEQLRIIYKKCLKTLKNNGYMAVIVSDFRDGPNFYLYHGDTAKILKEIGFKLTGITILHQDSKRLYPYGYPFVFVSNIHHQYVILVKKEVKNRD